MPSRRPGHGGRRQGDGDLPGREHGRQPRQLPRSGRGDHLHRVLHDHAGRPEQRLGHERGEGARAAASTPTRTPRRSPPSRRRRCRWSSRRRRRRTRRSVSRSPTATWSPTPATCASRARSRWPTTRRRSTCPAVSTVGNHDSFLDPGEAITCTASYTITQADLNSGSVTNVAKASAAGTDSNEDTETVTAVRNAGPVAGEDGVSVDLLDGRVSRSPTATWSRTPATCRSPARSRSTDDKATVTCPAVSTVGNLDAFLDPGESITCTASYTITQADLNSGSVTNVATAHARRAPTRTRTPRRSPPSRRRR